MDVPTANAVFFTNELPRVAALDRNLRAVPSGMRDAIARHLGVPPGPSQVASLIYGQQIDYVDFYRQTLQEDGSIKYAPCDTDDGLYYDEGAYSFCIGVWLARAPGSMEGANVFIESHAEDSDERSATLSIENLDGTIHIEDTGDPKCFDAAATQSLDRLMAFMKEVADTPKNRPFGFHVAGSTARHPSRPPSPAPGGDQ